MSRRTLFIVSICCILLLGFSGISVISYLVANESLTKYIQSNTLEITSSNIHSQVQRDLLQPITLSAHMARDTFVMDWIESGERNSEKIVEYLKSIKEHNQAETAFYISDAGYNYYHPDGIVRQLDKNSAADQWYFRIKHSSADFEVNLDVDAAAANRMTFFVNHKIYNRARDFLGVIGVGLSSDTLGKMIDTYQRSFDCRVYFVDREGHVVLKGSSFDDSDNIRKAEGIGEIAARVLSSRKGTYNYLRDDQFVFLKAQFIQELGWYLLVEQRQTVDDSVRNILWINLSVSLAITLLVASLMYLAINRY